MRVSALVSTDMLHSCSQTVGIFWTLSELELLLTGNYLLATSSSYSFTCSCLLIYYHVYICRWPLFFSYLFCLCLSSCQLVNPSPPMSGLLTIATEAQTDVLDRLLTLLAPADICRLAKACRLLHEAVPRRLSFIFNLDQLLLSFFDDPDAFRVLQSRTGAIISGSFALQFFTRTFFPQADMDLYVTAGARSEVGYWLLSHGYQFVARGPVLHPVTDAVVHPAQRREFNVALDVFHNIEGPNHGIVQGVLSIMDFHRWVGGALRKVQVHLVTSCPLYTVLKFHSSKSCRCCLTFFSLTLFR